MVLETEARDLMLGSRASRKGRVPHVARAGPRAHFAPVLKSGVSWCVCVCVCVCVCCEDQNVILTEKFPDGSTMMAVNPEGVEDRNSLAKLMATVEDCKDMDVTVGKVGLSVRELWDIELGVHPD